MDPDPYWRALAGVLVRGCHTHWQEGTLHNLLPLFSLSPPSMFIFEVLLSWFMGFMDGQAVLVMTSPWGWGQAIG